MQPGSRCHCWHLYGVIVSECSQKHTCLNINCSMTGSLTVGGALGLRRQRSSRGGRRSLKCCLRSSQGCETRERDDAELHLDKLGVLYGARERISMSTVKYQTENFAFQGANE